MPKNANFKTVKAAFKKGALAHHPDKANTTDTTTNAQNEAIFIKLKHAYDIYCYTEKERQQKGQDKNDKAAQAGQEEWHRTQDDEGDKDRTINETDIATLAEGQTPSKAVIIAELERIQASEGSRTHIHLAHLRSERPSDSAPDLRRKEFVLFPVQVKESGHWYT